MVSLREFITLQMQEVRRLRIENSELKRRLSNLGFNDTDAVSSE
jgi:regulator of replication initiation timing